MENVWRDHTITELLLPLHHVSIKYKPIHCQKKNHCARRHPRTKYICEFYDDKNIYSRMVKLRKIITMIFIISI